MERKLFIDVVKGIAMILVVMQHVGGILDDGIRLICKLDVPLFFICSGFLAYRRHINITIKIKSCIKRILIPFVLACIFSSIYWNISIYDVFTSSGKNGYWFLEALFIMYLIFWSIYRRTSTLIIGGITIELLLLILSKYGSESIDNIMGISYLSRYFPCFIIGALINKYQIDNIDNVIVRCGLLICAFIGLGINYSSTNVSFIAHVVGYSTGAVIAFYYIKNYVINKSSNNRILSAFAYVGRYSLNIYIIHFYLIKYISIESQGFAIDFMIIFLIAAVVSFLSIGIGKILTYCTPLNRVLTP